MDKIRRAFLSGTARGWSVLVALTMVCCTHMVTANTSSKCSDALISDGYCDSTNNNFDCDYDGGDCCACTCVDGIDYSCGDNGYDCQDPLAGCTLNANYHYYYYYYYYYYYVTYYYYHPYYSDDGVYNYYGDDDDDDFMITDDDDDDFMTTDDDDGFYNYYGDDDDDDDDDDGYGYYGDDGDDFITTDDDDFLTTVDDDETSLCTYSSKSDGKCDSENNNAKCDYDGGDCCECTCEDGIHTCGTSGYDCLNTSACSSGGNDSDLIVIIGATVGSLVVLGIAIAAVVFCYCRKVREVGLPAYRTEQVVDKEPTSKEKPSAIAYPVQPSVSKPPPPPYEG